MCELVEAIVTAPHLPDNDTDNDSHRLSLPDIDDSRMQVPKNSGLSS
jgi:hypothetical protein